jgi:hypothetical protein
MIWTYARSNETLHVETWFDPTHKDFRLIIRRVDGTEQVETFDDAATFQNRLSRLEHQLEAESWRTQSAMAMHDGWKL